MFEIAYNHQGITLALKSKSGGLLQKFLGRDKKLNLESLSSSDRNLIIAFADLRALSKDDSSDLNISPDHIWMSHDLAANLTSETAQILGLPPLVDLTLRTDAVGLVGSPNFRLKAEWFKNGQRQLPNRIGAILETSGGLRLLPLWLKEAVEVADGFKSEGSDVDHWGALSRFRQALDPGVRISGEDHSAKVSMTDFLAGLQVKVADRLSLSINDDASDFEVLPFSRHKLDKVEDVYSISENDSELRDQELSIFQSRVRERGAAPAYRLGPGSFLVVDRAAIPALEVMVEMQRAVKADRINFIKNPRARITEAVENSLRNEGRLDSLSPEAEEEAIESAAEPLFVETQEFSERVTGISLFEQLNLGGFESSGTTWLPEHFARQIAKVLGKLSMDDLQSVRKDIEQAVHQGQTEVQVGEVKLPASSDMLITIDSYLENKHNYGDYTDTDKKEEQQKKTGTYVLDGKRNIDDIEWTLKFNPRKALISNALPGTIRTRLKPHQIESFNWQLEAWQAGLPGILNADEPGLGKTLQTIAFLVWLKSNMSQKLSSQRGPVLVVAPTSLLENWEQEVVRHVSEPGLGHLIRLYGSATSARKMSGKAGRDIDSGEVKLDLGFLTEAIEDGRAHRYWLLTTYTTLTNYQHSLGRIPFSALIFDEIQTLKNPASLRAQSGLFMNADFRIGLTGTPVENSAIDIWAIMEQLAPGALGSLKEFRSRYNTPNDINMSELHDRIFKVNDTHPAFGLRRVKDNVATDLPKKLRRLHPRLMPAHQAMLYEEARDKLARGGRNAALKVLHHIRSVSVHPGLDMSGSDADFINCSGRLSATFDVLKRIAANNERVLVFIEHRQMQFRFIELVKSEFNLSNIDLINGDTPIQKRQAIVNRFQEHLSHDKGFDILVLGPKAAGVGLTLTAATHVIHLSRWWNPAVEEQCNDRVHRIGQTRPVSVHVPMAIHPGYREDSFDCLLQSLMQRKRNLANSALWPMGDNDDDAIELQKIVQAEKSENVADPIVSTINALLIRDGIPHSNIDKDGSVQI